MHLVLASVVSSATYEAPFATDHAIHIFNPFIIKTLVSSSTRSNSMAQIPPARLANPRSRRCGLMEAPKCIICCTATGQASMSVSGVVEP
jgi:hypothetical protein